MYYIILVIITLMSSVVQGITGMGYSMICMSLLTFFFAYKEIAISVKLLSLLFILPVIFKSRKSIKFRIMIVPLIFCFIGTSLGIYLFNFLPENILKFILAILLIIISLILLFNKKEISIKPCVKNGMIAGIIAGLTSGLCNVPGPPLAIYYLNTIKDDKEAYFSTITTHFFINGLYQMLLFATNKSIGIGSLRLAAIAFVPTLVGYLGGRKIFDKVNSKIIVKSVYILMIFMGISILLGLKIQN